jgi:hypothetical protein
MKMAACKQTMDKVKKKEDQQYTAFVLLAKENRETRTMD